MKLLNALIAVVSIFIISGCIVARDKDMSTQKLAIKNGWYYIDGEKFFIKGIGYEGTLPGEYPWTKWDRKFNSERFKRDMENIKSAGFNTLRTWAPLMEEELKLIQEAGLKVMFGVWIDPHADFGEAVFIKKVERQIENTLKYSKKYDCIIAYIIMNEPTVDVIHKSGSTETVKLWSNVKSMINKAHPGIPVSFSNTPVCDFVDMSLFDIYIYNIYMYAPATVRYSHGYTGVIEYLKELQKPGKPFIIGEYGLSVSKKGPGEFGYGGNTEEEQRDGILKMYRSLLDAGAEGNCVFTYLDGWWKNCNINNDAATHDDEPEEWFGLNGIADKGSPVDGTPRLAWKALKVYNNAIITSPVNGGIYYEKSVPVELFLMERVNAFKVISDGKCIYKQETKGKTYFAGKIPFEFTNAIKDVVFEFEFLDSTGKVLKKETITTLFAKDKIELPTISVATSVDDLGDSDNCNLTVTVSNSGLFTFGDVVDYIFYPHYGFDMGIAYTTSTAGKSDGMHFSEVFAINSSRVVTVGAGVTIHFGKFSKRITAAKILYRGNWTKAIAVPPYDGERNGFSSAPRGKQKQ